MKKQPKTNNQSGLNQIGLNQFGLEEFGIYVGLFNKINKTSISVKEALRTERMVHQYIAVSSGMQAETVTAETIISKRSKSTKALSYAQFQVKNGTSVAHSIYQRLKSSKTPQTRYELASTMSIRLSTICGQITPMEIAGLVKVVGTKKDPITLRTVELLVAM